MAKIKVTKRPGTKRDFILKPSRLRMFSFYTILFGIIFGTGLASRYIFNPNSSDLAQFEDRWLAYLAILLGGPILLAIMDVRRWTLFIREGDQVEGPAGIWGQLISIDLDAIDWARTSQSLKAWFKLGNGIYAANTKRRIIINPWFYNRDPYSEFLRLLGYPR